MLHHPLTCITTSIPLSFPSIKVRRLRRQPPMICRSLGSHGSRAGKGMKCFHEMELEVRDYEVDRFGVVNNSVYNSYCELGMCRLIDRIFFNIEPLPALSEAFFKYITPLKKGDKFLLKFRIYDYSAARLYFEEFIFKLPNYEPILECKSAVVLLDKKFHVTRIPTTLLANWINLCNQEISK